MTDDNMEDREDPLQDIKTTRIQEDEEEEGTAGVDYRRMFKGKDKKRFQTIPKRGEKDFEPDGTNKQERILQEGREAMYTALSFDAGLKQRAACGVWIEEYQMTHVPRELSTGRWFQNIGFGGPSGNWLLPEETLLMISSGRMELLDENGFEIYVLGAWGACIEAVGGVNAYLVYSQLRRSGYNTFRPGMLKDLPISADNSVHKQMSVSGNKLTYLKFQLHHLYVALSYILSGVFTYMSMILGLFQYLPSWIVPRSHSPYDSFYSSLSPIPTFSELSDEDIDEDALPISFEVWRPNPNWKRKSPGPPDFHICIVDGREPFPSLSKLERLYNSVARVHPIGAKGGKVVIAVLDCGISNYLALDSNLLTTSISLNLKS